jgi:hypothetical protein
VVAPEDLAMVQALLKVLFLIMLALAASSARRQGSR